MRKVNNVERDPDLLDEYDFSKLKLVRGKYVGRPVNHKFTIRLRPEKDGRWFAEIPAFSVRFLGSTRQEAVSKVQGLAFRVLADRLEQGKSVFGPSSISFSVVE
jgi:predicted RNase H-like HicB family nuclease